MLTFYVITFLIKVFLIYKVYQDFGIRFDLPVLNFLHVLMVITFLLIIKLTVFGISYADVQAFKQLSTAEKIFHEMADVFVIGMMTSLYFFYKSLL